MNFSCENLVRNVARSDHIRLKIQFQKAQASERGDASRAAAQKAGRRRSSTCVREFQVELAYIYHGTMRNILRKQITEIEQFFPEFNIPSGI